MNWVRVGGISAIAGGALRIVDSFTTELLSQGTLAVLYFVTDVLLLAGIAAFWFKRRAAIGIPGTAGLAIFVIGILVVRASAFDTGSYPLGAAESLAGLGIYSIAFFVRGTPPPTYAAISWISALVFGVASVALPPAGRLVTATAAAIFFGVGFLAIGVDLYPRLASKPRPGG